jgi:BlaI family transcriptional regulator, penicillinase repressor
MMSSVSRDHTDLCYPAFVLRYRFKPFAQGLEMVLGELERPIMEAIWQLGQVTVADVVAELKTGHAYNTVKTIMDRLEKKGLLRRARQSKPVIYEAVVSAADLQQQTSRTVIEGLVSQFGQTALVEFAAVVRENPENLEKLRQLLATIPDEK